MVALLDPRHAAPPAGRAGGGARIDHQGAGSPQILPPGAHIPEPATLPTFTPEAAAALVHAVPVVVTHTFAERHVRRVHLTLAAAQRAVERAEDRGQTAYIVLSRIVPVGVMRP